MPLQVVFGSIFKLSTTQTSLCYASLICLEVFPLSLLVYIAWAPTGKEDDWYKGDKRFGEQRGQLANELPPWEADETFLTSYERSRQPSTALQTRVADDNELTAFIELRGNVRAAEGKAIQDLINTMSRTVKAEYKSYALFRPGHHAMGQGTLPTIPSQPSSFASGTSAGSFAERRASDARTASLGREERRASDALSASLGRERRAADASDTLTGPISRLSLTTAVSESTKSS
eukprot:gnl/TRDRNA2_/TRDRNA2_172623_c0_seq1.p1 gnl/TRDRNA2_/TRDRNA2_172623_c0~~gnl/TRDRNA2_/TRDRNA2_172623_c0_seq1.p1  ORF type:complete len:233 (-),score=28.71 gnl/TRDRNA2_/TRDRNA2_172623_c0_seq1:65-763(-)